MIGTFPWWWMLAVIVSVPVLAVALQRDIARAVRRRAARERIRELGRAFHQSKILIGAALLPSMQKMVRSASEMERSLQRLRAAYRDGDVIIPVQQEVADTSKWSGMSAPSVADALTLALTTPVVRPLRTRGPVGRHALPYDSSREGHTPPRPGRRVAR